MMMIWDLAGEHQDKGLKSCLTQEPFTYIKEVWSLNPSPESLSEHVLCFQAAVGVPLQRPLKERWLHLVSVSQS